MAAITPQPPASVEPVTVQTNPVEPKLARSDKVTWGPLFAVVWTVGLFFAAQFAAGVLILIYPLARGWSLQQSTDWLTDSSLANFIVICLAEGLMIVMLQGLLHYKRSSFAALGWNRRPRWSDLGRALAAFGVYAVGFLLIIMPLVSRLLNLNTDQKQQLGFDNVHGPQLLFVFIALVVLPPLVEETMVRGFLYSGLRKKLPLVIAALVTSAIFAAAHLEWGSGAPLLWTAALDTFVLSLFLVYLREKTGSLWASVCMHGLKNLLAFIALFVLVK